MALLRAIAASGEQCTVTEQVVTSALATDVDVYLADAVSAGEDFLVQFVSNSTGSIRVLDTYGHLFDVIPGGGSAMFNVQSGNWKRCPSAEIIAFRTAQKATAGSVTCTLGTAAPAAIGTTTPTSWMKVLMNDGAIGYIPVWK